MASPEAEEDAEQAGSVAQCPFCPVESNSVRLLRTRDVLRHMDLHHRNDPLAHCKWGLPDKETVRCNICHRWFMGQLGIAKHRAGTICRQNQNDRNVRAPTRNVNRPLNEGIHINRPNTGINVIPWGVANGDWVFPNVDENPFRVDGNIVNWDQFVSDTKALVAEFADHPLWTIGHYSWVVPLANIMKVSISKALEEAGKNQGVDSWVWVMVMMVVPGVVSLLQRAIRTGAIKGTTVRHTLLVIEENPLRIFSIGKTILTALERTRMPITRNNSNRGDTLKYLARMIDARIMEGRVNAAVNIAERMGNVEVHSNDYPSPETLSAQLEEVFLPNDPAFDFIPEADETEVANAQKYVISSAMVEDALRSCPRQSASGGLSGWTYQSLQAVMLSAPSLADGGAMSDLARLFTLILQGAIPPDWNSLIMGGRISLIPKSDGGKRILTISSTLFRLFGKVVNAMVAKSIGEALVPHQFAVGVQSGVDILAQVASSAYAREVELSEGYGLMSIDIKIAYNSMRNKCIWQGLCTYAPHLCYMFRKLYANDWGLWGRNGKLLGTRRAGLSMGDPLASLFFCIGLQDTLKKLQQCLMTRVMVVDDSLPKPFVIAFADDICISAPMNVLMPFAETAVGMLADVGLNVHPHKSKIIHPSAHEFTDTSIFEVVSTFDPMQVPVGDMDYVYSTVETKLTRALVGLDYAIQYAQPRSAFAMIKYSYAHRAVYLMRNAFRGGETQPLFEEYRRKLALGVARVAGMVEEVPWLHPPPSGQRHIPLWAKRVYLSADQGGAGVLDVAGFNGEFQRGNLRSRVRDFLSKHFPSYSLTFERIFPLETVGSLQCLQLEGDASDARNGVMHDAAQRAVGNSLGNTPTPSITNLKQACYRAIAQEVYEETRMLLGPTAAKPALAWLTSSADKGAGRFLAWCGGADSRMALQASDFQTALRLRLEPASPRDACECSGYDADPAPSRGSNAYHPLHCQMVGNRHYLPRHNIIVEALAMFIRALRPNAVVEIERPLVVEDNDGSYRPVADVVVNMDGRLVFIDVAITDPTSESALKKGSDSYSDRASDLEAARIRAKYRGARYRGNNGEAIVGGMVFPFVVESTGRLGKDALSLLNLIQEGGSWQRSVLLGVVSITCATFVSRMFTFYDPTQNNHGMYRRINEPQAPTPTGTRHVRFADEE